MDATLPCDGGGPRESRWLLAKQRQPRTPAAQPAEAPPRPALQEVSQFMLLEREVEVQSRARMRKALRKIRPRTMCLYSAASMFERNASAARQSAFSNPRFAPFG